MDDSFYNKKHLFQQIATGNELAFRKVFHDCNAKLFPFVLKLTRSETIAEDLVQETFLRLWVHRCEVGEMDRPIAWLYTVASNLSLSWLRAHAAETRKLQRIKIKDSTRSEQIIEQLSVEEAQLLISQAVDLLPPKRKQIYKLSREQGLSHKEIAEQLHLSTSTIKNQMVNALKFIKDYLYQSSGITIPILILLFSN